jgi:hypothetical protein
MKADKTNADKTNAIIDAMQEVRAANNCNWMNILKLAVAYAPADKVLQALDWIDACDSAINNRFQMLIEEIKKDS